MPRNLISPNRMCAKINLAKFSRNTTHLDLAKFFPGENFPLYGSSVSVSMPGRYKCIKHELQGMMLLRHCLNEISYVLYKTSLR